MTEDGYGYNCYRFYYFNSLGKKNKTKQKTRKVKDNFGEDGFQLFTRGQKNASQFSEITHI